MKTEDKERRRFPRILCETFASISRIDSSEKEECYIQNIGVNGAMVFTNFEFKNQEKTRLTFQINNEKIEKIASVVSIRKIPFKRKEILEIGKNLSCNYIVNLKFDQLLKSGELEDMLNLL